MMNDFLAYFNLKTIARYPKLTANKVQVLIFSHSFGMLMHYLVAYQINLKPIIAAADLGLVKLFLILQITWNSRR